MKKIQLSLYSALVLVILFMTLWSTRKGGGSPLFDQSSRTTLYAETVVGCEPDLRAEIYFPEGEYDLSKFSFDVTACDWETEGNYQVPVLYDGKVTNCVVSVQVAGSAEFVPETRTGLNEHTAITN